MHGSANTATNANYATNAGTASNSNQLGGVAAAQYKVKGDFAVVTGTISMSNGSGSADINYPSGFNKDNSVVISIGLDISASGIFSYMSYADTSLYEVRMLSSNIFVKLSSPDGIGTSSTKNFKVILMKV